MNSMFKKAVPAFVAAAALAVPTGAMAHGSVWTTTVKTATAAVGGVVGTTSNTSYLASNHGYVIAYTESNGLSDHGMINYKALPSAYRNQASFTLSRLLSEGDTGVQTHATCQGDTGDVAKLWTPEAIISWQSITPTTPAGAEPFWNYIPWQKTAAGLGDTAEVQVWIAKIKDLTGVDLATATDLPAACASIGGTYKAADTTASTTASLVSAYSADISAPLSAQVTSLTSDKTALTTQLTGLQADLASANGAKDGALADLATANAAKATALSDLAAANSAKATALANLAAANTAKTSADAARDAALAQKATALAEVTRLSRTLTASTAASTLSGSTAANTGAPVNVSGPGGLTVTINLVISSAKATSLKLSSTIIGTGTATISSGGTVSKTISLSTAAKAKVKALSSSLPVTIEVRGGDRFATKAWTFTK